MGKGFSSGVGISIETTEITDKAVTLAKMADLAQDLFIGRTTASTGVPETATITAAARTVLDDTTVAAMVDTLGGAAATGTGGIARASSPTFVTPALGTPASGVMTNVTGIPVGALANGTDGQLITWDASGVAAVVATGTAAQVLTSNGAGAAPTFQAAGSGAVTRAGGNTVEGTTTSLTAVNLLAIASLSIGASVPLYSKVQLRKTTGAANTASVGLTVNATEVRASFAWSGSANAAEPGSFLMLPQSASTNYAAGGAGWYSNSGGNVSITNLANNAEWPVATITDWTIRALVADANITMGADELHLYTYSVS